MTTGNELNREKSFIEISNEVEQNGYTNLTDEEIDRYIEEKNNLAATEAENNVRLEQLNERQNETLELLREQTSTLKQLLNLKIEEFYENRKVNNNE